VNQQQRRALKLLYGDVSFEPITADVIAKFVAKVAKESDLIEMKNQGAMYCSERDSFVFPPEINLPKMKGQRTHERKRRSH
jgi:hypothetical protein